MVVERYIICGFARVSRMAELLEVTEECGTTDRNEAQEKACMQRTKSRKYTISVLQAGRLMISKERRSAEAYLTKIKLLRVCTKDCTNPTELRTGLLPL